MNWTVLTAPVPLAGPSGSALRAVSRLRLWLALVALAAAGLLAATPFLLPVLQQLLAGRPLPLSAGVVLGLQDVQVLIFTALLVAVGVWTAPPLGLDAPLVRARLAGQAVSARLLGLLPASVLGGTLAALAVLALSQALRARLPADLGVFPAMHPWAAATGAFYGGIVEELLFRWGLLSLLAFALVRLGASRGVGFWVANVVAALAFGAAHLPAALQLGVPRTPLVVGYLLAANALAGLVFGFCFRRRGLESAMLAHGSADVWLHVVFPALGL